MFIFEVCVIPFLRNFMNFVETVHVELSDEGRDMFVSKKVW